MRNKLSLDLGLVDIPTINLPAKGELLIHDEGMPGLNLRLRASGARTWIVRSNQGEINRRQTLGDALSLPLVHARRLAQAPDDGAGVDTAALPDHITVADILPRYLAYGRKGLWKPSTTRLMRYVALRHILPKFGKRAIRDIKPANVVVWHQGQPHIIRPYSPVHTIGANGLCGRPWGAPDGVKPMQRASQESEDGARQLSPRWASQGPLGFLGCVAK